MESPLPLTGGVPPAPSAVSPEIGFEGLQEISSHPAPTSAAAPEPGFEGLQSVDSGFEGLREADRLDLGDEKDLTGDESFRPAQFIAENPNVAQEPERFQKLLNVYRQKRIKGLNFGEVAKAAVHEAPGIIAKTAKGAGQLVSRLVDIGVQPAVNEVLGRVTGADMAKLREETQKKQLKAAGEITAGTEQAVTGLSQLGSQGARKLFGTSPEKATNSELYDQLLVDAEFHKQTNQIAQGKSDFAKSIGLDSDFLSKNGVELDPKAIENLSLVDPLTLVATAGVFKVVGVGGKIVASAATKLGAEAVINGLQKVAGKSLEAVGKGVIATGKVAQKVPLRTPGVAAMGASLASGNVPGVVASAVAPALARAGGRALEKAGEVVAGVGQAATPGFIGPPTAAAARLAEISASPVAQVAKGAAKGAVTGTVIAAPLALAADENQTAGAILGGGAALGAIAGGAGAAAQAAGRGVANVVAKKFFDPQSIPFEPVQSPGYGINKGLDAIHDAAIKTLPEPEQNAINNFREALRDKGGEIYAQDPKSYLDRIRESLKNENGGAELTPEQEAKAQTYANTHAFFDGYLADAAGNQRRVIFLNGGAKGLPHDAGHLFQSLLSPERQGELRQVVLDSYSPKQLDEFGKAYTESLGDPEYFNKLGEEAGRNKVADEIIAENFSQLFGNTQLTDLKAPPKFLEALGRTAAEAGESLGLDLTGGRTTPDLQATPSYRLQGVLRNAAQEVLNLPATKEKLTLTKATLPEKVPTAAEIPKIPEVPPAVSDIFQKAFPEKPPVPSYKIQGTVREAPPEVGTPTPKELPSPEDAAAARAKETGISEARELTKDNPEAAKTVEDIAKSMEAGNPALRIEHRGITSEAKTGPRGEARGPRRGTQEAGYSELEKLQIENRKNAPESVVSVHEKTFVPVRWVNQGGKATLIAMSMDKILGNIRKITEEAAAKRADSLIPYESVGGELTEKGWGEALADVKDYAENQSNGYRGDGSRLVRPSDEAGVSIPAENPNYTPKILGESQANFANLVQGIAPPETARSVKGTIPGNVKAQLVAEANLKTPQPMAVISAKHISKQTFGKPFEGRTVKETNPLRNELASRGVNVRSLTEATERLAAQDIASTGIAPAEAQMKAPVTDIIRGGFLPKEADLSKVRNGEKQGETFNADGTVFVPNPGQKLDVVTLASVNLPLEGLTESAVAKAVAPYASALRNQSVKAGVFRLSAPGPDGKPQVSVDVNVVTDQKNRSSSMAFAKANNQEAIFDLASQESIPTEGNGQTVLKTPSEVATAARALSEGKLISPEEISRIATDNKPVEEVGKQILAYSPEEWLRVNGSWEGSLTSEAYRLGLGLKNATDLKLLTEFRDRATSEARAKMAAGDFEGTYPLTTKAQFFSEALGAATDTGSAANPRVGWRRVMPEAKSPFPAGKGAATTERLFLPAADFDKSLDPVDTAAIRTPKGRIFTGSWHGAAAMDLIDAVSNGTLGEEIPKSVRDNLSEGDLSGFGEDGFTTISGKFLTREQAFDHAEKIGQMKRAPFAGPGSNVGWLESKEFANERSFLPRTEAGKALEKQGFNFEFEDGVGENGREYKFTILQPGEKELVPVGWIYGRLDNLSSEAAVDSVFVEPEFRQRGFSKTLYRELGAYLKENDISFVKGDVISPAAYAARKEIFPNTKNRAAGEYLGRVSRGPITVSKIGPRSKFLPQTSAGKALAKKGFDLHLDENSDKTQFVIRAVNSKTGNDVGRVEFHINESGDGEIKNVEVNKEFRGKGIGETLYREAGQTMKDLGATKVSGEIVGFEAYHLRKKVFPNTKNIPGAEHQADYTTVSTIGPRSKFLPRKRNVEASDIQKRDKSGRPLTAGGLVDYEKLYAEKTKKEKAQEKADLASIEGKYSIPKEEIPDPRRLTGWLLPNKKFVPISTEYHEQFLADNAEQLNRDFGTSLSKKGDPEERFGALQKGFTRIRYIPNSGHVVIESSAALWSPSVRGEVLKQLESHLPDIDNLQISLLDNRGNVVDSSSRKVIELESPEKLTEFEDALNELKGTVTTKRGNVGPTDIQRARAFGQETAPKSH